jgi:DNA-directed RNA polymerase I, II, and III subunit RPABC2
MADKYEDIESSGGSDSDAGSADGGDYKYITSKKIKLPAHLQMGGIGDDDDDADDIGDDDMDDEAEEEDVEEDVELEGLETGEPTKSAFFDEEDDDEDYDDDDDDDDENHLQKFSDNLRKNVITDHHPELMIHNYHEVEAMCNIVRNERGIIMDPLHKTLPFITKYERAKILGERAKQINAGARPFVVVSDEIIDGYVIALMEFEQKKLPMIIRRPLPNNGCEYWRVSDLENLV